MGDDLDIYNDLDEFQETEQQKSKELEEWEKKFANAQVEINNYQALNKALAKKIKTMEVNFQNLLDTAKAEIKRKDTLIAQLRKEKDDICFRRKGFGPKAVSKRIIENHQQEPQLFKPEETVVASDIVKDDKRPKVVSNPFKQDPRQEPKRFKQDETVVPSDVINKNGKRYKQINDDKQKAEEIVHEKKKADHKRGRQSSSEAKSSQERSSSDTKSVHHRDRDRNRSRRRSRSHSRSRSRERCRSGKRNSRAKETQRSRRSRSRSASRSRSSHRTNNNKTSHRNDSREHETKASTNDKRNIQKSMELLFGKTPKPNSPAIELTTEQKAKVLERMLANAEPYTPMEQYTPQSVNRAGSDSTSDKITNKRQSEEEISSYFLSNVREFEQSKTEATKCESTDHIDCIVNDVAVSKETKPATESKTETIEKIPVLDLISDEDQSDADSIEVLEDASNDITAIKAPKPTTENEDKITRDAFKRTPEIAAEAFEKIPGLDLINEEHQAGSESIEQTEDALNLEINGTLNEDLIEKISSPKLITQEEEELFEKIPSPKLITQEDQVNVESIDPNDITKIKTTKSETENADETTRQAIEKTQATSTKAIEQIPSLAETESIDKLEVASNLEIKTTIIKSNITKVIEKVSDSNLIPEKHQAEVVAIEHLEDASNDLTEIETSDSTAKNEDVTNHQAISTKAIEQIPSLDLVNEEYQAGTESIDQPEDASNLEIKTTINNSNITNEIEKVSDSNLIPQKDQAEVESIEHLEDVSNDLTAKNEDATNQHAIEQTQATSTKAIEQIPPLDLITEDEVESNDQLENVPNDILQINAVITDKQTTKSTENIPNPNEVTKKTEVGSIEQSEEANDIAEINTTEPAAENEVEAAQESPNEKEESKVIDIEPEANNTTAEKELTKTDDKQATSCSDKLPTDDEENTSPIIKAATAREDKLTEFDDANQESTKELNKCDEPDQAKDIEDPAIDNNVTHEPQMRSASAVQIIEDIRLPVMMEIEDLADTVDRLSGNDEDLLETKYNNEEHQLNLLDADKETSTEDLQALKSNVEVVSTTLTPKPSIVTSIVMYAQPDSTKIDHNEVEAVERLILSDEVMAKSLDLSLSFEIDSIELTLEKLHQQSHDDEQPDEATVTSTSMKALKQDLIKILTQSPVQQPPAANVDPSPAKLKNKPKKTGARSVSERSTPTKNSEHSSATPERVEKTPLKKRKLDLDDKTEDQVVLQTPPDSAKTRSPSPQHVTIDETLNASNSDNNNSSISNSSIVTKRCSLGNSDYQFERINDEVVLRVTRRPRRRRPAPSATVNTK
ncbi:hypothetical protein ACLKA7_000307 [Drosophila subpalustris]